MSDLPDDLTCSNASVVGAREVIRQTAASAAPINCRRAERSFIGTVYAVVCFIGVPLFDAKTLTADRVSAQPQSVFPAFSLAPSAGGRPV